MRLATAVCLGLWYALNVNGVYAQVLPEFDSSDFQVLSLEQESKALAVSNGRLFYCTVQMKSDSGYVLVSRCLPFVGIDEAIQQEAALEPERAAARLAADQSAIAAAKAAAEIVRAQAEAAAEVVRQKLENDAQSARAAADYELAAASPRALLASLSDNDLQNAMIKALKANSCTLNIGSPWSVSGPALQKLADASGVTPKELAYIGSDIGSRMVSAVFSLAKSGVVTRNNAQITLKDCP